MSEIVRQTIEFTDVTLRDGEQQDKRYDIMPVEARVVVFDELVNAGIKRMEIGHLANPHDVELATALVSHIAEKEAEGDTRYGDVELQVLFGSQKELIEDGLDALEGFDKDRVIVHVYDRVSSELRGLASDPQSYQGTANNVVEASQLALDAGFTRLSVSGEGAVNHKDSVEEVTDYYVQIIENLDARGATEININLANTFGLSLGGEWDIDGLRSFNDDVKNASDLPITTSIHAHNDSRASSDFAMSALEAGFDAVEGTIIGMGERSGNVPLVDVMVRLLEKSRIVAEADQFSRSARQAGKIAVEQAFWEDRQIAEAMANNLDNWYDSASTIALIYDTFSRLRRTSVGDPDAYAAGSGPHGQANKRFGEDPLNHPIWKNYAMFAIPHAMMGRPEAIEIIEVNKDRIRDITLLTHAAGGASKKVVENAIEFAPDHERKASEAMARKLMNRILATASGRTAAGADVAAT